jgi:CRP-like cAMP-binding protein
MFIEYSDLEVQELVAAANRPKIPIKKSQENKEEKKADILKIDIKSLARQGSVKKYENGHTLFFEGDEGSDMYMILQGKVEVLSNENVVATLETGDIFGEMSLVDNLPRSATIRVSEPLSALVLTRENFNSIVSSEPTIAFRVMQNLSKRIRLMNQEIFMLKNKGLDDAVVENGDVINTTDDEDDF